MKKDVQTMLVWDSDQTKASHRVLSFGAGVQSTALALLAADGLLKNPRGEQITFDAAVFADTGEDPQDEGHSVYSHVEWMKTQIPFPLLVRTAGRLGDALIHGSGPSHRFPAIPTYLEGCGLTPRQCTAEYKINVVNKTIRQEILGLKPRQRTPKGVLVEQFMGISLDEAGRMLRAQARERENPTRWARFVYPLIQWMNWTRQDCIDYLSKRVQHQVPRSACVFCPYHSNEEWSRIKQRNGKDWQRVLEIDKALRDPSSVSAKRLRSDRYLHRARKPIDEVDFGDSASNDKNMAGECLGMCGL